MTNDRRPYLYLGVFLTSLSAVLFEVTLTRIFSVTLWYHFAYFVVSMALFGLGAGGLAAFFLRRAVVERFPRILLEAAALQFASIIFCAVVILNVRFTIGFSVPGLLDFFLAYLVCSLPFLCAGFILSVAFRNLHQETPALYAVDLAGSAGGCVLFIGAIRWWSGPAVVLGAALLCLAAVASFWRCSERKTPWAMAGSLAALAVSALLALNASDVFRVKFAKYYDETGLASQILLEKWSPLARITVYDRPFFAADPLRPFMWGASPTYGSPRPVPQLWVEQDASAGTPITRFRGDLAEVKHLRFDITSLVHHVKPRSRTFIVGAGGGRDILTALSFESPYVKACEINPVIVDAVRNRFGEFTGGLFDLPQVSVEVAEARSYIRRSNERFGVVQISLTDSFAATASGAFALAENSLYTVEAFSDYLRHLEDGGFLSVTRFLFHPRNQTLRVVTLARGSLEALGTAEPWRHVAVVGTDRLEGVATVLVKKTPLTPEEIARVATVARRLQWEALYLPGQPGDETFQRALNTPRLTDFTGAYPYDVRPTTDDRPFFFQMVRFRNALDLMRGRAVSGQTFNYYAVSVLVALLVVSAVLTVAFYFLPLLLSRGVEPLPRTWGLYFVLLGLGFMLIEIPLIQKGSLYLGHPTYGLTVVLFSLLVFTGLGSFWSGSLPAADLPRTLRRHLWLVAGAVVLVASVMELAMPATIGAPFVVRLTLAVVLCGGLGFLLGAPFPSGIRLVSASKENAIPWVWALNGGASVTGSIIAMAVAMAFGYRLTLLAGALTYVAASLVLLARERRLARASASP